MLFAGAGAVLLDQFYGDGLLTNHWLAAIGASLREAASTLPEGRGLRIPQIGAGTARAQRPVLPMLERRSAHLHVHRRFRGLLPPAMQKTRGLPRGGDEGV